MELLILICLIIIIGLLLTDKLVFKKKPKNTLLNTANQNLPDIMGRPKQIKTASKSISIAETQENKQEPDPDPATLDIEYDENEDRGIQIPEEELDEVFSNLPDLAEEEEEWHKYGISVGDDNLARGVTYEELSTVSALLQKGNMEQAQKETAVATFQKLQGTELFSLLENSIEGASQKIAELFDSALSSESDDGSSTTLRKSDSGDFDIGEFV